MEKKGIQAQGPCTERGLWRHRESLVTRVQQKRLHIEVLPAHVHTMKGSHALVGRLRARYTNLSHPGMRLKPRLHSAQ